MPNISRENILDHWLIQVLGTEAFSRTPLAGDASFRKYYRVQRLQQSQDSQVPPETFVVMDAPPPESPQTFVQVAELLRANDLSVPKILQTHFEHGFLLLSDFGNQLYLDALNEKTKDDLYEDAFSALIRIQRCQASLPVFDKKLLKTELDVLFKDWYLKKHMKIDEIELSRIKWPEIKMNSQVNSSLDPILDSIIEVIESQPKVLMHRDYHSRNLMVLSHKNPGILDFQDALIGPVTYDLVSLLQDCYIAWPRAMVETWVFDFQKRLEAEKMLAKVPKERFLRWFDFTGLQRHLKNLGIFSRKFHRDNNPNYLKDLPMPFKYIQEACSRYPELQTLGSLFETLSSLNSVNSGHSTNSINSVNSADSVNSVNAVNTNIPIRG